MEIKAFSAYRFNNAVVGRSGDCIAPPYDVIDSSMQDELYHKNSYNIVRAIKADKQRIAHRIANRRDKIYFIGVG